MLYFFSDTITRSRGNIDEPAMTVAGAMPLTRTKGPRPMASSRIKWLMPALLMSYASLPLLGTTAFAELVRTIEAGRFCALRTFPASCASTKFEGRLICSVRPQTFSAGNQGARAGERAGGVVVDNK